MSLRSILLLLVWFPIPALALAQTSEEDDSESILPSVKPQKTDQTPDLARAAKLIVEKTNDFRRKQELEPVKSNSELTSAAQYFADYMAKTDRYGHTADGSRPSQRAKERGYEYCLVAENIAYQYSSAGFGTEELAQKFVQGWIDSPEHRKNMLNGAATETGVAISHSENSGHYYAVQMFGRPKSLRTEFRLSNESQVELTYKIGDRSFSLPPRYTRTHMRCRSTEITLQWQEDSQRQTKTINPENGDKFVIAGQGEKLRIEKQ